jgi:uncharacterized protein YjbJ (UPF0337 family)
LNWEHIESHWHQVKGRAKVQWGELTDNDFELVAGRRDALLGKIQERYVLAKGEAERRLAAWFAPHQPPR